MPTEQRETLVIHL